jgi:hypothetical protein
MVRKPFFIFPISPKKASTWEAIINPISPKNPKNTHAVTYPTKRERRGIAEKYRYIPVNKKSKILVKIIVMTILFPI